MAKIGNESRLILKLTRERMDARYLRWKQLSSNPNSSSNNESWMAGYEYAFSEWKDTLLGIIIELEKGS